MIENLLFVYLCYQKYLSFSHGYNVILKPQKWRVLYARYYGGYWELKNK